MIFLAFTSLVDTTPFEWIPAKELKKDDVLIEGLIVKEITNFAIFARTERQDKVTLNIQDHLGRIGNSHVNPEIPHAPYSIPISYNVYVDREFFRPAEPIN